MAEIMLDTPRGQRRKLVSPETDAASRAAEAIIGHLCARRGLGDEWNAIDAETQAEIKASWVGLILRNML